MNIEVLSIKKHLNAPLKNGNKKKKERGVIHNHDIVLTVNKKKWEKAERRMNKCR